MCRQRIVESVLHEVLVLEQGIFKTFSDTLQHTSGEPLRLYGADFPEIATRIISALDAH